MLKWLWLSGLVILLDQATKYLASSRLVLHEPVAVVPFFNLTLMHNTGAAFSFLSGAGGWQRWLFVLIAAVVGVVIVVWLKRLQRGEIWTALALALILGGALGNVIDRLWFGYVVDFIDVYYGTWHWPAFNIADSAITIGVAVFVIEGFFGGRSQVAVSSGRRGEP